MTLHTQNRHQISGFTFVEMSIVMLILAVLTGGILVGKDLIHAAEVRATVKQAEMFNLAYNTFQLKYNCWPGDCGEAAQMGFSDGFSIQISKNDNRMTADDLLEYISPVSTAYALTIPDQHLIVDSSLPPPIPGGGGSGPSTSLGKNTGGGDGAVPLNGNSNCIIENNITNSQMEGPVGFHMLQESSLISGLDVKTRVYLKLSDAFATIGGKSFPAFWVAGNLSSGVDSKGNPSIITENGAYLQIIASFQPFAAAAIPVKDAADIDRKIDDGLPLYGTIRATSTTQTNLQIGPTFSAKRDLGANSCLTAANNSSSNSGTGGVVFSGGSAVNLSANGSAVYNIKTTNPNAKCAQVIRLGLAGCNG